MQQVGSPRSSTSDPANLFVAGFIGSPAMNFLPGRIEEGAARTALGDLELAPALRKALDAERGRREVIVGIRPEHFEDAALVEDRQREQGAEFTAEVEVLESMGSDKYAYFAVEGERASSVDLADLAADAGTADVPGGASGSLTARISAASQAREGERMLVWVDTSKIQLFDPGTGLNLGPDARRAQ